MKTEILQLEPHDDLLTILDKVGWCKSDRVLLVFPKKMRIILNQLELSRLAHVAAQNGSRIAIVTSNRVTLKIAKEIGIPTFSSTLVAQRNRWRASIKKSEFPVIKGYDSIRRIKERDLLIRKDAPVSLNWAILALVFLTFLGMFAFLIPSLTIHLYPQTTSQTLELEITASTEVDTPNITGFIPSYRGEVILNGTQSRESTTTTSLPLSKAVGEVLLLNLGKDTVVVPAGTIMIIENTPERKYVTTETVQVLPGDQSSTLQVEAITPGLEGNISSDQVLIFTGDLAAKIIVQSHSEFTGGISSSVTAPSDQDYQVLRDSLSKDLAIQAETQILEINPSIITSSIKMDEVISEEILYPIGAPSDRAELTITVRYHYFYYDPEDIRWIGRQLMDQSLKSKTQGASSQIIIKNLNDPVFSDENATWMVYLEREIRNRFELELVKQNLRGKPLVDGLEYLNNEIPHSKSAEIKSRFLIWKWFPLFSERIILEEVYAIEG